MVLLRRTVTADAAGSPVETWAADAAPIWAQRVDARGAESANAGAQRSIVTSTYRVRYRAELAADNAPGIFRIRVDGRDHNLIAAIEDEEEPRRAALLLSLSYIQGEPTLTAVP